MTAGELREKIEEIMEKEGLRLSELTEKVSLDRSYISKVINGDPNKKMTETLVKKLQKKFPAYFPDKQTVPHNVPRETTKTTQESLSAILEIASSNKVLAEANLTLADAHKILAKNNEDLISLLKLRSSADQQTFEETVATVLALREYLIEFAAEQKKVSTTEVSQGFHSKVRKAMEKLGRKGNPVASGK